MIGFGHILSLLTGIWKFWGKLYMYMTEWHNVKALSGLIGRFFHGITNLVKITELGENKKKCVAFLQHNICAESVGANQT